MDKKRLVDGTTALAEKRPRVIKIEPAERPQNVRLRVAAYTRVSSDSEDQLNSFAAQNRYYTELISGKAEWRMVDIYADEGITGTSVAKRDDFQRMMADCRSGLIDQILVKSISRFSRNTKDCLQNIRELKELGVNVRFEREGIDTVNVSSELITAIYAAFAQKESESISGNMRWSYQRRMESGTFLPSSMAYGYRLDGKKIVIDPEAALIVSRIFQWYLSGVNKTEIAKRLNEEGVPSGQQKQWYAAAVRYILTNEKYTGDSLWQKTYTSHTLPATRYRKGEDGQPEFIPEQAEIVRWIYERYLTGASLRMIKEELEQQGVKCFEDSPEWTISRIRSILQNEKYCGDVLMQKTFRQDFINRKAIKNTGQLPMYLIENHHEGIVSREKYDAVQAEMARRNAAKSPSKNAVTGMASYASKYALSERLVCGECGTLYRRCTWTRNGEKRVVWRCVSRLDYGKKYCHNSPTLDEAPLQQAILAVLNTAMADKNSLIRQITAAMETELIPFPGGTMSLGDIECRLRVLEQQFQTLLEKATDDPAAYGGQFKEILDEQTFLKEKRSVILANNNEQAKANQRIMDAAQTLENASPYITEWDESAVRQLVETVKILSKDEVAVTLKGGIEICQKIMY